MKVSPSSRKSEHPAKIALVAILLIAMIAVGANAIDNHPECEELIGHPTISELLVVYGSVNLLIMGALFAMNRHFPDKMPAAIHNKVLYAIYIIWALMIVSWVIIVRIKMPLYHKFDKCVDSGTYIFVLVFIVISFPSLKIVPAMIH